MDDGAGRRDLDPGESFGGFVEATSEVGVDLLAVRLTGAGERYRVSGTADAQAELTQLQALSLLGRRIEYAAWLEARLMFGIGSGYAELDYDDRPGIPTCSGISGALAAAVELEVGDHAFFGVMGWFGVAGHPGNVECEFSSVMPCLGVRF
ncbi:MAG: hypothetical protein H6835_03860 [Planctomycetes bacterium]|nr:hypothetical protein [Planctomycetota bacterium]